MRLIGYAVTMTCLAAIPGQAPAQYSPPQSITVVSDDNYPPYLFRDGDGRLEGIVKDKWELWSRRTGVTARLEGMEWAKAQRLILDGGADVIEAMSQTDERAKLYEYSPQWGTLETRIFFHDSIGGINDVASLRGFTVGTKDGSACTGWLRQRGVESVRPYPDSDALVRAAAAGDIRLFCMDTPIAQYYLLKHGIAREFRQTAPLYRVHFYWAVPKGRIEARDFIQSGFERVSAEELQDIDDRWLGNPLKLPIHARYFYYAAAFIASLLAGAALLILWNRSLSRRVAVRTHALGERVKELAVLHGAARLFQSESAIDLALLNRLASLLPPGWQYPEICVARIVYGSIEAQTPGWRDTAWRQSARFATGNGQAGLIEVAYVEPRPAEAEGPFLAEERTLIDSMAELLGANFERARIHTALRESESELRLHAERLRDLSRRLMDAEGLERRNINRELHDSIAQNLSALQINLAVLRIELGNNTPRAAALRIDDAQALLEATSHRVRDVMAELRPPALDDYGLLAAVRHHAATVAARVGVALTVEGTDFEPRLAPATETALYRIVQEALNNIAKHAQARNVAVMLASTPAFVRLNVVDDGVGFEAARAAPGANYGVTTMHERAEAVGACLRIRSAPGHGTRIEIELGEERGVTIRVLLADDHAVMREGLRALMAASDLISIVGEVSDGREAARLTLELLPDVVVMDISMPGLNGIEAAGMIRTRGSSARIVILSMHSSTEHVYRAFAAGASGYVLKSSAIGEVISAVRTVHAGVRYLSPALRLESGEALRGDTRSSPLDSLSSRERQVLQLVVEGRSSAEIAGIVHLSPKSVETYRSRMMKKLGVGDITGLVKFALEHGLTPGA